MKKEVGKFHDFLRSRKLRMTRTREAVFREILSTPTIHPNAYEIHHKLKKKGFRVSLATIYRTLKLLVKMGLVSRVDLGENHSHYEPGMIKTGHGHLICISCGRVREFSHKAIRSELSRVGRATDFRLEKFSVQVFGFCRDCRKL